MFIFLRPINPKGDKVFQLQIQDGDRDSMRSIVSLKASEFRVYESTGEAEIRVVREGDLSGEASVPYSTVDHTAVDGVDYEGTAGVLHFKPDSAEEVIRLVVKDDVFAEGDESFGINLLNPKGASLGVLDRASVVIVDAEAGGAQYAVACITELAELPLQCGQYLRQAARVDAERDQLIHQD